MTIHDTETFAPNDIRRGAQFPPKNSLGGLRVGRVFGVEVRLDVTLIIVFVLVATSLGEGTLPRWHPDWAPGLVWAVAIGAAVLFFLSVLLHELSHALVAKAQGTSVRGITLFMLGGIAQIEKEPSTPGREFVMAVVGPLTSIVIGVVCLTLGTQETVNANWLAQEPALAMREVGPMGTLLLWLGPLNLVLGVFNLLPGFPLDGGRVLRAVLWAVTKDPGRATRWAAFVGQVFGWTLTALGILMAFGSAFPIVGGGLVQGIWFVLIGFYLSSAARATVEHAWTRRALEGIPARALMLTRFESVEPKLPVDRLVNEYLLRSDQRCFPVTAEGRFVGLASLADVRRTDGDWSALDVGSIMTPAEAVVTISPDESAADALEGLARRDVDQLAVVDGNRMLVGLLRRRDMLQWLSLYGAEPSDEHHSFGKTPSFPAAHATHPPR